MLGRPATGGGTILQIGLPAAHQSGETGGILVCDQRLQPGHGLNQGRERVAAVLVERLDLEVKSRTLACHQRSDCELRVEGRTGQPREARRGLAALGEGGKKRDVDRVREAEHVGNQPVVVV